MPAPKPPPSSQPIDLNRDYPCPCRRQGRLVPITLTEALGCDRCQQIFTVEEDGHSITQLVNSYAYRRTWRWNGSQWMVHRPKLSKNYLPAALCVILVLLVVWLPLALHSADTAVWLWIAIALLLAILPALMLWLMYRR